jgi:hypothetical protein
VACGSAVVGRSSPLLTQRQRLPDRSIRTLCPNLAMSPSFFSVDEDGATGLWLVAEVVFRVIHIAYSPWAVTVTTFNSPPSVSACVMRVVEDHPDKT